MPPRLKMSLLERNRLTNAVPATKSANSVEQRSTLSGYRITRLQTWIPQTNDLTSTGLIPPSMGCDCPVTVEAAPGSMCQEYVDIVPVPASYTPGLPFPVRYDVTAVYSDGLA